MTILPPDPSEDSELELARISHALSREGVQDGASDLFSMGREHCQMDKESPIEDKDDATDCADSPREREKCGLEESSGFFTQDELALLEPQNLPRHIAIIMDGNRRWARGGKLRAVRGHWGGAEILTKIVRASVELGIKTLTVFGFSTENWSRPDSEIESLMKLFEFYLIHKKEMMVKEGIRFDVIGDPSRFSPKIQELIAQTRKATECGERINLVLALNYGARDEIRRAVLKILKRHNEQRVTEEELTESFFAKFLDTSRWGDPDLLIRTGSEMRVSNFLLWQISYSELYISDKFWPDFTHKELLRSLLVYQSRRRRIGK